MLTPPNWRGAKFPKDEATFRRKPLAEARGGDRRILEHAAAHDFVLISTDSDFERLLGQIPGAKVVILRSCLALVGRAILPAAGFQPARAA